MTNFKYAGIALAITSALALSACDTSINVEPDDHDHDHGHDHDHDHETTGRLVILTGDSDTPSAVVYDLENDAALDTFELGFASRLYTSPNRRYALAIQRDQNTVRFIDSGFETEDHGDHSHSHTHDPSLLSFSLSGERPTHYDYFVSNGAVFYDAAPGMPSSVDVISDHSIGHERIVASVTLNTNMHGAAEVRGDHLFTTYRSDAVTDSTLPDFVEVYSRHDDHYEFVQRFDEPCPGLHGSAINTLSVAFGCRDGVLLVQEDDHGHSHDHDHDDFEAIKIANPDGMSGRVGTLWAHEAHDIFIGRAGQELVLLDASHADEMQVIDWREEGSDAEIVSVAFNHSGNRFAVLDDTGMLTVIRLRPDHDHDNYPYQIQSQFEVLEHVHTGTAMTTSAVNHQAYITDPDHNELIIVDLHDGEIIETRSLDFSPGAAVWLGFTD